MTTDDTGCLPCQQKYTPVPQVQVPEPPACEGTQCEEIYPAECIAYAGQNLPCYDIKTGDDFGVIFRKIDDGCPTNPVSILKVLNIIKNTPALKALLCSITCSCECGGGGGDDGEEPCVCTDATDLAAAMTLYNGAVRVTLTWTPSTAAARTHQLAQYRAVGGTTWLPMHSWHVNATTSSLVMDGLSEDVLYEFRVTTYCADDESCSDVSDTVTGIKETEPEVCECDKASNVAVVMSFPGGGALAQAYVTWTPSSAPTMTGQQVRYRMQGATAWNTLPTVLAGSATSTAITGLTEAIIYEFQVVSICGEDGTCIDVSDIVSKYAMKCVLPESEASDTTLTVSVPTPPAIITSLRYMLRLKSTNALVASIVISAPFTTPNVNHTFTGLTPSTQYQLVIDYYGGPQTTNCDGATLTTTATPIPPCPPPTPFSSGVNAEIPLPAENLNHQGTHFS